MRFLTKSWCDDGWSLSTDLTAVFIVHDIFCGWHQANFSKRNNFDDWETFAADILWWIRHDAGRRLRVDTQGS